MAQFHFKAIKKDGGVFEATREAETASALYKLLKAEDRELISAKEIGGRRLGLPLLRNFFSVVGIKEKIMFANNIGGMLEAGLPLSRALLVIERQTKNQRFKKIIASIGDLVRQGKSFNEALAGFPAIFPKLFISMARSGEEAGSLAASMKSIGKQLESVHSLERKVKGAMIYPVVILSIMFIVGILMLIFVLPTLTSTFKELNIPLPLSTKIIIAVSDFLSGNVVLAFTALFILSIGVVSLWRLKTTRRMIEFILLRLPVIGLLVKETNAARTARTLSSLSAAGVSVLVSIEITGEVVQNYFYETVFKEASEAVKKGETISSVFSRHEELFPSFVAEMTAIGEESGRLPEMLANVATFYEGEVEQKTKDLSTIIEPVLMIIIGVGVGVFAYSMIVPMYSLVNSFQ